MLKQPRDTTNNEVIIQGLPFSSTEQDIEAFFNKNNCGEITRINLLRRPHDGKSKGCAFVTFAENISVAEAETLNCSDFQGRTVFIEQTRPKGEREWQGNNNKGYNNGYGGSYNQPDFTPGNEVIVQGLPFASTEKDIQEVFEKCGEITRLKLSKTKDGKSKGFAFITFLESDAVFKAEEHNDTEFGGRKIYVERTKPQADRDWHNDGHRGGYGGGGRGGYGGGYGGDKGGQRQHANQESTIFVGNLSFGTKQHKLYEMFEECGKVIEVRLSKKPDGSSRGFAHVEFETPEEAEYSLSMNGQNLDGRPLNVDLMDKRRVGGEGGFRGGRGGRGRGGY